MPSRPRRKARFCRRQTFTKAKRRLEPRRRGARRLKEERHRARQAKARAAAAAALLAFPGSDPGGLSPRGADGKRQPTYAALHMGSISAQQSSTSAGNGPGTGTLLADARQQRRGGLSEERSGVHLFARSIGKISCAVARHPTHSPEAQRWAELVADRGYVLALMMV